MQVVHRIVYLTCFSNLSKLRRQLLPWPLPPQCLPHQPSPRFKYALFYPWYVFWPICFPFISQESVEEEEEEDDVAVEDTYRSVMSSYASQARPGPTYIRKTPFNTSRSTSPCSCVLPHLALTSTLCVLAPSSVRCETGPRCGSHAHFGHDPLNSTAAEQHRALDRDGLKGIRHTIATPRTQARAHFPPLAVLVIIVSLSSSHSRVSYSRSRTSSLVPVEAAALLPDGQHVPCACVLL